MVKVPQRAKQRYKSKGKRNSIKGQLETKYEPKKILESNAEK